MTLVLVLLWAVTVNFIATSVMQQGMESGRNKVHGMNISQILLTQIQH